LWHELIVDGNRTKDIIADQLPKKIDQVVFCPLTETQKLVYRNFLDTREVQTMLNKDNPCGCGSGKLCVKYFLGITLMHTCFSRGKDCHYKTWKSSWVFEYMAILLKISNHLALILPGEFLPAKSCKSIEAHVFNSTK
jgi:DNA excision repair protein ERCC-6-like 2